MIDRDEDEPLPTDELFALPAEGEHEPREIAGRLISGLDEFRDLRDGKAVILFLLRTQPKVKAQRIILGEMCLPRFQGTLAPLGVWLLAKVCGELPDYIMVLDSEWWTQADPITREALVFHELKHAAIKVDKEGEPRFNDAGTPLWDLLGHDIEEFDAVVRRYGAWKPDIMSFLRASIEHSGART